MKSAPTAEVESRRRAGRRSPEPLARKLHLPEEPIGGTRFMASPRNDVVALRGSRGDTHKSIRRSVMVRSSSCVSSTSSSAFVRRVLIAACLALGTAGVTTISADASADSASAATTFIKTKHATITKLIKDKAGDTKVDAE